MSTMSISGTRIQSEVMPTEESAHRASFAFVACAVILATITYMMPISESWNRSRFETYVDVKNMEASARDGTLMRQIALGSLGLFGLIAVVWPGGKSLQFRSTLGFLSIAYLTFCVVSCLWTDDFAISLRRLIALNCEILAALAIAKRTSSRQFVWIVFICTLSWLGLGILAELSLNTFRPWHQGYRFSGIFHPNETGINCGLLILASLYLGASEKRGKSWLFAVAAVASVFLLLSGSRTAMASTVLSIVALWVFLATTSRFVYSTLAAGMAAACIFIAIGLGMFEVSTDLIATGREDVELSSLTGRLPLWLDLVENYARQSPLAGYGYAAFWTADRIAEVSKTQTWTVGSTHSTYIDLLLNVGILGAGLCLLTMALAFFKGARLERKHAWAGYGFIALIVFFGLADGLFETTVGITWFLSFFGICGVCFLLLDGNRSLQTDSTASTFSQPNLNPLPRRSRAIA